MSEYKIINILDMLGEESLGEDEVKNILSDFSCRKKEIEEFIHKNAVEFAKKRTSITYLVINNCGVIEAIFTLTHKSLEIENIGFSNTLIRKIEKFAKLDENAKSYSLSAFLIAQFGKSNLPETKISGNEMMGMVFNILKKVQHDIGGGIVFLECEEIEGLLKFYCNEPNNFIEFGERFSAAEDTKYKQLFRVL